mgnify:FL=1
MAEEDITLHYFDVHAKGEAIRMMFHYIGVAFNDHKIDFDEWPAVKASGLCEFKQLPCLEIEGQKLVQSNSILRYLCRKYDLYSTDPFKAYLIESVCDLKEDLYKSLYKYFADKDFEGMDNWVSETLPQKLELLENRLKQNKDGKGWFVGEKVTMADVQVFQFLYDYMLSPLKKPKFEHVLSGSAPSLKEFANRFIESSESLRSYLESREDKIF